MKDGAFVVQLLSRLSNSLFSSAQRTEIFASLGIDIFKQFNDNLASLFATNFNLQKDTSVAVVRGILSVQFVPLGWGAAAVKYKRI